MKTISINLYTINELKEQFPEGYEKAIQKMREENEYCGLSDYMNDNLRELLDNTEIKLVEGYKMQVFYSLSYCQGDGAMFEGTFLYRDKYYVTVKQSGHYYHYNSKNITVESEDIDGNEVDTGEIEEEFNKIYVDICEKLAKAGYEYIEEENEEANIVDNCIANDYTFESDGTMNNG